MTRPESWTLDELAEALGYLANPKTEVKIEIQVPPGKRSTFEHEYLVKTGQTAPSPGICGYSVLSDSSDKYGRQYRIILKPVGTPPHHLQDILRMGAGGNKRISSVHLVETMLERGFLLGSVQLDRVSGMRRSHEEIAFDRGFQLAET